MMSYPDWAALCKSEPAKARAICGEKMGWKRSSVAPDAWWLSDNGEPMQPVDRRWSPISDLNHTAMMVEKVRDSGLSEQFAFDEAMAANTPKADDLLWSDVLLLPLSLIAWAACVALEKEE